MSKPLTRWLPASARLLARKPWRPQLTQLEDRSTPATFTEAGVVLNLDLLASEQVSIVANATDYTLTLTGGTWTGTDSANVTGDTTTTLTVTAAGIAAFTDVNLTDSGAGTAATFNDSGANSYDDNFTVTLDSGSAGVSFAGASSFGTNSLSVTTDRNIAVNGGAAVTTTSGGITLIAQGTNAGTYIGVDVQGSVTSSGGSVTVQGQGGDTGSDNFGVRVSGSVSGGTGQTTSVTGTGRGDASTNYGVFVSGGTLTASGSGTVAVSGTAGGGAGGLLNTGVLVQGNTAAITSGGGSVSVTGQGGQGNSSRGVQAFAGGTITAGGSGAVTVDGTGGGTIGSGVRVSGGGASITSTNGTVSITGTGAAAQGIESVAGDTISSGGNQAITLTADQMDLGGTVNAGTGTVTLRNRSAGRLIDLGSTTDAAANTLELSDAELDRVTAGVLVIGRATSGNITVSAAISPALTANLALVTGGAVSNTNAGVDITTTTLSVTAGTGITLDTAVDTLTASTTGAGAISISEADAVTLTSITAANGSITITTGGATTVTSVVSTTDSDANDISITASVGDITVTTVNAGGTAGDVTLQATTGNIFDDGSNATVVTADVLTLTADRAIGAPGATLQIDSSANSLVAATTGAGPFAGAPTPGIWVADTNTITITSATTQDGVILLDSAGTMTVGTVSAGGTGRNVRLQTSAGDIDFGTAGSVTAAGDAVRLSAAGSITESGTAVKVTALSLNAFAGTGIGTADPLNATVTNLAAATGNGGLYVTNSGSLTVSSLTVFGATINGVIAAAGDVVLTTAAGDLTLNAPVTALNNAITLNSDDLINAASVVNAGAGTVTIQPVTAGRAIDLGTNTAGQLGLTDAELDLVTAGTLVIGSATAGNITLSADISRSASTSVQLISGADIASTPTAGRFDTGGGTLSITTGTGVGQGFTATRTGTDVIATGLSFGAGTDLKVAVTGPAANTGYPQLNTSDAVDLTGLDLALSGAYVPVAGDEFVVVSAGTLTGTFTGLANGAVVTFNGVSLHVFYTNTTATLRVNRAPTGVSPGGPYTIAEGAGLTVTAPVATDADGDTLTYTWDVNGDGTFGDEAGGTISNGGRTVTYTPAQLLALGLADGAFSTAALAVRVSDGLTFGTVTATGSLTVTNVAPTIAVTGAGTANEGAVYTLTLGAVTDPGQDTVSQYRVNWGDGTSSTYATAGAKAHTYADDGAYTVTVDLTDEDGTFTNVGTAHTVTVSNVAPVATAPVTVPSPDEGATTSFALGSFTDPAGVNDGPYTVVVTWGDGGSDTFTVAVPGSLGSLAHTYADNGTYAVTVSVSEAGGTPTGTSGFNVTVSNVAPTPTISGPTAGTEGTALAFTATAADPAGVNDPIAFTWSVTKNGAAFAAGTGTAFTFTPDDDGTYVLSLTADDGDGGVTTVTRTLPVTNVAPTITAFNVPITAFETQAVSVSAAATDPAGANDPLTFSWSVTKNGAAYATGSGTGFTFTPDDNGIYAVTLAVTDGDGGQATAVKTVSVANVAPVITAMDVPATGVGGSPMTVSATASDIAGPQDPLTYTWAVARNGVPYTTGTGPTFTFTPAVGGEYTVTVTVSDGDDGTAVATRTITVTPPPRLVTAIGNTVTLRNLRNGSVVEVVPFPGFLGGVNVASGDLNGDGVLDLVVGAAGGGGPHVKVFDGATGMELASFFAFDVGFTGGVNVAAANGRIVVGAGAGGGPHVKVIDFARIGERRADGVIADSALVGNFFAFDVGFTGGVRVAAGDVTGDGVPDVVVGAGPGGSAHVKGIDGTRLGQVRPDGVIADSAAFANFFAFDLSFAGGVYVAATNGRIAVGAGPGAGPHVKVIDAANLGLVRADGVIADEAPLASFFAFSPDFSGGVRVGFADVNIDSLPDLITAAGPGGGPHVKAFSLPSLLEIESVFVGNAADTRGVNV